ncbi:uncharacterized protein [Mytilus edulis]|uniref:uncharacterized protein n=1 Tax=Mytilus edulis TaxID=6550 RepID=UPI0039EE73A2
MQKILLFFVLVLLLAVVEQTSGQKCSLQYCRRRPRSDCGCKGCCWGKLNCRFGSCRRHRGDRRRGSSGRRGRGGRRGRRISSCFCSDCEGGGRRRGQTGEDGPD